MNRHHKISSIARPLTLTQYRKQLEIVDKKIRNTEIGILILQFSASIFGMNEKASHSIELRIKIMKKYEYRKQIILQAIDELTGALVLKKKPERQYTETLSYQIELMQKKKLMKQQASCH
jgi:hypothetical protein